MFKELEPIKTLNLTDKEKKQLLEHSIETQTIHILLELIAD